MATQSYALANGRVPLASVCLQGMEECPAGVIGCDQGVTEKTQLEGTVG
jgi:hypothetical protein